MTDEIQILTEQEANKKDITLKYPGATADLIATKNVFDVYLKTKVLDVCGDVLRENNKPMRIWWFLLYHNMGHGCSLIIYHI